MPKEVGKIRVGVLALQGAFIEHVEMLKSLGVKAVEVRTAKDLNGLDGLIIPGGESTTMNLLIGEIKKNMKNCPIFGTCAGAILLSQQNLLNIDVERNAYGSQLDSFEDDFQFQGHNFHGIFIRAPKIIKVGPKVEVLAKNSKDEIVLVREGNYLAATFHPELTEDAIIHKYFIQNLLKAS